MGEADGAAAKGADGAIGDAATGALVATGAKVGASVNETTGEAAMGAADGAAAKGADGAIGVVRGAAATGLDAAFETPVLAVGEARADG
jgi:hypothetical protein